MEIVYPRCCDIDVHKASVCCCISIKGGSRNEKPAAAFRYDDSAVAGNGRVVAAMEGNDGGDGSHWGVLEAGLESAGKRI
jgi:hypothetical protein